MSHPRFTKTIKNLPVIVPFIGPETLERQRGAPFKARIGANESVFGPSPKAIAAIQDSAAQTWKYCDPDNYDLKHAIAEFHGIAPENIIIIEGIDGGLGLVNRILIEPGDTVVTSDGAYPTFLFHVAACGGQSVKVPFKNNHEDIFTLLERAEKFKAKMLYFSNPDNPMGTWWEASEIKMMIRNLPEGTTLILDEAYCDTAPYGSIPEIDTSNPMVLRFRTFSKAYGLAGARVGYCIGEANVISMFENVRNHFGINRLAQIAALAALKDQDHLKETIASISISRAKIANISRENNLAPIESGTNFVTVDLLRDERFAQRVMQELLLRDVFVRMPSVAPLNRCIRVTAGAQADLELLEAMLPQALASAV
ncbi:MAG: Histidinol-phosphate aminotransferase [Hyphomicrobiaceae bacterium hypho_1]